MSISLRIKQLIDEKKLNISSFEKKIGAGMNSIGTLITKNSNISGVLLSKILVTYPEVNANWLILGKGTMYITYNVEKTEHSQVSESNYEYSRSCSSCKDKDLIIKLQQEKIHHLEISLKNSNIKEEVYS